jgi:hypothetical protein
MPTIASLGDAAPVAPTEVKSPVASSVNSAANCSQSRVSRAAPKR